MTEELFRFSNLLSLKIEEKVDAIDPFDERADYDMRRDLNTRITVMLEIRDAIQQVIKEMHP